MELIARGMPVWTIFLPAGALLCGLIHILFIEETYVLATGVAFLFLMIPVMIFFRDPPRQIGEGVVSPADGKILTVEERRGGWVYISIFMNIHNVHVNRAPWKGIVVSMEHISGGYVPAFDKGSDLN